MERKHTKLTVILALVLMLALALAGCSENEVPVDSATALADALAAEGTQTLSVDEAIVITEPLVVNGQKTIVGSGSITLNIADAGTEGAGGSASVLGCPKLTAEDLSADAAVLQVSADASLTLSGSVVVDGANVANGVLALSGATVELTESAAVQNGKGCGIYVCENATLNVPGGSVLNSLNHGVVSLGTVNVTGGNLSGAEKGAVIYSAGNLNISDGVIAKGGVHNVYVAAGSVTMTGGKVEWATKDGIVVASGVTANVTGGTIENCGTHGLCNSGAMETGAVTLTECGIANNAGGTLNMVDTTVDISAVYCLANLGGTVTAKNFSALSCDVTAVCNFAGDMTLENLTVDGSRAGCISNESGNLTVDGATLGLCREKPINVGSGVVKMDNVTVEGTTGEYFGAYIYGGEFYLSNSSISYINYSALRADGQCYVELNNVTVDDTMASGIWARGATIVANDLTLTNVRGHALNNSGGNVTITNLTATDIGKNAILQNNGTTVLNNVSFLNVGDQGAYVENGSLTIKGGSFENVAQNGVYSRPDGTGEVFLEDVTYTNVTKYGLNNGYKMSAKNVTIYKTGETGILNKKEMYLESVCVRQPGSDCIYNDANGVMVANSVSCYDAGSKSNPVYNRGVLALYNMWICGSKNHGIRNVGYITGDGLNISTVGKVGLYNQEGEIEDLKNVYIEKTGDHAINNQKGTLNVTDLTIRNVQGELANAIYNTGDMTVAQVNVDGGMSHAIFNRGNITGTDITIANSADVSYYNYDDGYSDITNLTVSNSGNHAVCNVTSMKLTDVTVTGTVKGCGIINGELAQEGKNGKTATMELNGAVVLSDCNSHGLCNVQGSTLSGAADVSVSNATGNGVYNNASTLTLGTVSINGAKYGFSNSGTANVGALTVAHTLNNAIHSSKPLTVAGDLVISDVYGETTGDNQGNGIFNTNALTVEGSLSIDGITASGNTGNSSNNAIFNRGTLTVSGDVTIGDVKAGHAILGTAGSVNIPGTLTINGTVGKDNIVYFYSSAKSADFGKLVKTSDVDKVILKVDGSTRLTVGSAELVGKSKDVIVANSSAVVTLNNTTITGGNNALHGAGGDIIANNLTVTGSTIGINIRNAKSEIKLQGNVVVAETTHGSAIHVNSKGKLVIEGTLTVDSNSNQTGVNVYAGSTLELVGGSLTINNAKKSMNVDGIVIGDEASVITINNNSGAEHGIYQNGTFDMKGTVNVSGAAAADFRLVECVGGTTTIGVLNRADDTAREVIRGSGTAQVTVNGGTLTGSGKDVVVASGESAICLNNVAIHGGNNALYGAGGDIVANSVTIDGSSIAVNIRNANSVITVQGTSTVANVTHGSAIHVNKNGKLVIEGALTVDSNSNQTGVNVYAGSTLELAGGSLTINNAKKSMNVDGIVIGDEASVITINNNSGAEHGIYQNGTFDMKGTVNVSGAAAADFRLVECVGGTTTIGVLNRADNTAREVIRGSGTAQVTVNGGVLTGSGKDVVVASGSAVVNVNNVTINGGNNALYAAGGTINGSNVSVTGASIAINESNASSVVTLSGSNTFANTTHGTCMHIRGELTIKEGATLTVQDPANVGFKIYKTGKLNVEKDATVNIVNCKKGWNTEAGYSFIRGENATVTVNGTAA